MSHSKSGSGMLWKPLKNLMSKARRKREENMAQAAINGEQLTLGIPLQHMRPPPTKYGGPLPTFTPIEIGNVDAIKQEPQPETNPVYQQHHQEQQAQQQAMPPQIVGMGMLGPEHIQQQLQQQQMQQGGQPWLMDDNALLDLDMQGMDGAPNWEGWDDLVKDFQMDTQTGPDMQMGLGGVNNWW